MNKPVTHRWKCESVELFILHESDVTSDYVEWMNKPVVNQFLESRFSIQDEASVRDFVRINFDSPTSLFCGIRATSLSGKHVGNIKLAPINFYHGLAEVGIMIGDESAWGKGIGTVAIRLISDIARHELGLRKLTAGCYARNIGSRIAFQRAGFEIVCERKDHFLVNGNTDSLILLDHML